MSYRIATGWEVWGPEKRPKMGRVQETGSSVTASQNMALWKQSLDTILVFVAPTASSARRNHGKYLINFFDGLLVTKSSVLW